MNRRWAAAGTAGVLALVVAAVWAAGTGNLPWDGPERAASATAQVGPEGGTFSFPGGAVVTVPEGAVASDTTLRFTAPRDLDADEAGPLDGVRAAGSTFDISLASGGRDDIQPAVPLTVTLPRGDDARHLLALPYTPDGDAYALLPSADGGTATTISLPHLSPKYVAYVSDQALLDSFFPQRVERNRGDCARDLTVAGQKVTLGSRGWSLADDSPIFACLQPGSEGYVRVGIANRTNSILSVAATSDVRLAASHGDYEEEVVTHVSRLLPFGEKVEAYVGRDGELVGSIATKDLPATIELAADFRTFAAESIVKLFGLAVGLLTGEGNAGRTLETVGTLLEHGDLVSCVQNSMAPLTGNATIGQVVNAGAGCFGTLVGLLAGQLDLAKAVWRVAWLGDALKALADTVLSSVSGIRLQLGNTLRVAVAGPPGGAGTGGQPFTLEANVANFAAGETISLFDRLTIPYPKIWTGAMSEPDVVMNFAEDCGGTTADCPHVTFVNLASARAEEYFGSDPVRHWAGQPCSGGAPGKVEGPATLTLGGQPARLYRQRCGEDRHASPRYAWLVPDKQLFVMITDSGASPEILQGALERVRWH